MRTPPAFMERNSLTNCLVRGAISMTRLLALAYDMLLPIGVQALAPLVQRYLRLVHAPPTASIVHHDADTQCCTLRERRLPGRAWSPPTIGRGRRYEILSYSTNVDTAPTCPHTYCPARHTGMRHDLTSRSACHSTAQLVTFALRALRKAR